MKESSFDKGFNFTLGIFFAILAIMLGIGILALIVQNFNKVIAWAIAILIFALAYFLLNRIWHHIRMIDKRWGIWLEKHWPKK